MYVCMCAYVYVCVRTYMCAYVCICVCLSMDRRILLEWSIGSPAESVCGYEAVVARLLYRQREEVGDACLRRARLNVLCDLRPILVEGLYPLWGGEGEKGEGEGMNK
eukprot:GHVU01215474.1.p3 GENE.GHVU01215474.1~~GHVU01215474.1.p3  ORF type:complete len:107 (+),score=3.47 GHVU01215474.1:272-592(+)